MAGRLTIGIERSCNMCLSFVFCVSWNACG